ncbi:hypothetical protein BKA82DRAFT_4019032 [Pisolithus tinctorius]|nr:hypothetical protein BKA82DRAFT_4019032 [Pisolithus tinctorius]
MPGPSGGAPALLEQIADALVAPTPVPGVGSTPTPAFIDHVVVQPHEAQPASEQHPGLSSQAESSMRTQPPHKAKGAKPSSGKSRGIPKLPSNAPSLDSPIEVWRNFINKEQKHPHWDNDSKSMLMAMLPGVLGTSSRPDDSETESNPPSLKRMILVPSQLGRGQPSHGHITSLGQAAITTYLTANGVSTYEADNALQWAHQVGQEYVNSIIANGGENNPQVMAKIKPLRRALAEPCPPSNIGLREWYKCQAQAIGCAINQIPPGHMPLWADNQLIISAFASVAFIYDLPHCPHGEVSTTRGSPPVKDSEPEEGKMTDDLFEDEDRL